MDKFVKSCLVTLLALSSTLFAADPWSTNRLDSLLGRVDRFRGLVGDQKSDLEITATDHGQTTASSRYRLFLHPSTIRRDVLLRVLSPEIEHGNLILSRGDEMWILTRKSSRPVPVSVQQRLLGEASIGDVLNVEMRGRSRGTVEAMGSRWKLELEAAVPDALYERIELVVDAATARPLEERFSSRSGRLLKIMRFKKFLRVGGQELASHLEITDGVNPGRVTQIHFSRYEPGRFPMGTFDKDNLRNLSLED